MILALIHAILLLQDSPTAKDAHALAELAWEAEVFEFNEPGGRMDHYASALGGLLHLDFSGPTVSVERLTATLNGAFLLFDTLQPKDTLRALSEAKRPSLAALELLKEHGVSCLQDMLANPKSADLLAMLPPRERRSLGANIANRKLFSIALEMLRHNTLDDAKLGELLSEHHHHLAEGLGLSTAILETVLNTAKAAGAWGGKFNGSGGGGCLFVYAPQDATSEILAKVAALGYPGRILSPSAGISASRSL
jgi:galactokinase